MSGKYRRGQSEYVGPTLAERVFSKPDSISIEIEVQGKKYWGFLNPSQEKPFPSSFDLYFWGDYYGQIRYTPEGWESSNLGHTPVIERVGEYIMAWYE